MYNFKDLITRSYIEHTEEKENNIAHIYYQEFHTVREDANASYIFSKEHFYKKLIKQIDTFIRSTVHNYNVDSSYFDAIEEIKDFESWEKNDLKRKQEIYDDLGYNHTFTLTNWEETKNAKELNKALEEGLELVDPVMIISPSETIQAEDLVLRKSKLEYLKSEAERARDAKGIVELDDDEQSTNVASETISLDSSNDYRPKREDVIESIVIKALEFVKPLGGFYLGVDLLDVDDMKRLNDYTRSIIMTGKLPSDASSFPKLEVPAQFIRKTIHFVFESIGKKYKKEFLNLVHLFEDFNDTAISTTNRKFSTYEGTYENKLEDISY